MGIPLEYLPIPEGEAELLVTVDCRAGQRNVSPVPCCKRKDRANELIHWLARGMGNDGGGDRTKAAGRLPLPLLEEYRPGFDPLHTAGELIFQKLTDYFSMPVRRLDPGVEGYEPKRAEEFCRGKAALYRKKKICARIII